MRSMRKLSLLLALVFTVIFKPCHATDRDELLSITKMDPEALTQSSITSLFGNPSKIEEGKRKTSWFYKQGNDNLVITWNKKNALVDKVSFTSEAVGIKTFDKSVSSKLVSGSTELSQALQLLGTPKDMTIKLNKQEVHYSFQDKVLRLFFRDNKLVDYCLY
jgi:hypothetical protein